MKVKELIRQLKKMPQDCEVFTSAHDNEEWEVQSHSNSVRHYVRAYYEPELKAKDNPNSLGYTPGWSDDYKRLMNMPKEWITIHG